MNERESIYMQIPPGNDVPRIVNAIIEIPKGGRNKYELDKKTGLFRLDRYLFASSHYPGDYGLIPQTLAADGDPLDVLVMVNDPTFSGCLIETRVIGLFKMRDNGDDDFKVFGVPNSDPLFAEVHELDDVPKHFLKEVEHFFATYKQLEGVDIEVQGWGTVKEAIDEVNISVERYAKTKTSYSRVTAS
ncbi:MAG: inorganic diphosphatase [Elusimicrobia bacterium]|nr:inorganic diphosphatase [Elusimicrobiota bacterium]